MTIIVRRPQTKQPEGRNRLNLGQTLSRDLVFAINPAFGLEGIRTSASWPASSNGIGGKAYSTYTQFPLRAAVVSSNVFSVGWMCRHISNGSNTALWELFDGATSKILVYHRFNSGGSYALNWPEWDSFFGSGSGYVPTAGVFHSYAITKLGNLVTHYVNGSVLGTTAPSGSSSSFNITEVRLNTGSLAHISMFAFWNRQLRNAEVQAWHSNPWQLFEPRRIITPVGAAAPTTFIPSWARQNSRVIGGGV